MDNFYLLYKKSQTFEFEKLSIIESQKIFSKKELDLLFQLLEATVSRYKHQNYLEFPICKAPYGWTHNKELKSISKKIFCILKDNKNYDNLNKAGIAQYILETKNVFVVCVVFNVKVSKIKEILLQTMCCISIDEQKNIKVWKAY